MRCGFHAGRVDWTRDISRVKVEKPRVKHVWICAFVGWLVLVSSYFSQEVVLSVYLTGIAALLCGVRAKNEKETATHAWAITHARSARPPGPPDERPDERASYLCILRPRHAA